MTIKSIAKKLKRHRSTLFREIKRGGHITQEGYVGMSAHGDYRQRRRKCKPREKIRGNVKSYVDKRLKLKWSPEQIAGRRKLEGSSPIGVETIYRYIYRDRKNGGTLWTHLRHRRTKRRRRCPPQRWPKQIPRLSAENRPKEINDRQRVGDFERDMIVGRGRRGHILTIVDRRSRLVRLRKAEQLKPRHVHHLTVKALNGLTVLSVTNDNVLSSKIT